MNVTTKTRGFSLIELLIVVSMLGIIASLAFPAYTGYVSRSRQASAQQFMMDVSNAEETYRLDALTYVAAADAAAITATLRLSPSQTLGTYYTFTVTNVTPTTYTITATPQNGQPGPAFTLDQAGAKTGW